MATDETVHCAACGKPAITRCRCKGCTEGMDRNGDPHPTDYCTKVCQNAHQYEHELQCRLANDWKQLYRAGDLLQKMFYSNRELMFATVVARVEKIDGKLHVHGGTREDSETLVDFPDALFVEEEDKKKMLAWMNCVESVTWMEKALQSALTDTHAKIEGIEVEVDAAEEKAQVMFYDVAGSRIQTAVRHMLFRVTLEEDTSYYAFDLSAAQYGHPRTVTPWDVYETAMLGSVVQVQPVSTTAAGIATNIARAREAPQGAASAGCVTLNYSRQSFNVAITEWVKKQKAVAMSDLLRHPEEQFINEVADFVRTVTGEVKAFISWLDDHGGVRGINGDTLSVCTQQYVSGQRDMAGKYAVAGEAKAVEAEGQADLVNHVSRVRIVDNVQQYEEELEHAKKRRERAVEGGEDAKKGGEDVEGGEAAKVVRTPKRTVSTQKSERRRLGSRKVRS